ncbi:MAG: TipAS antibiotic-recognition domain-containing protein [Microbacteriaceae bacterium]|nr:TipAS antibiotic-recognition domain-containing protein [Microbacteriaceae bacterium]
MSVVPLFSHDDYRGEVVERWGKKAWSQSSSWWKHINAIGREAFLAEGVALKVEYLEAKAAELPVTDDSVGALVLRHRTWITQGWGGIEPTAEQFIGLGQMYVADERFARHYGGVEGASYVRDAILAWVAATQKNSDASDGSKRATKGTAS